MNQAFETLQKKKIKQSDQLNFEGFRAQLNILINLLITKHEKQEQNPMKLIIYLFIYLCVVISLHFVVGELLSKKFES